MTVAEPMTLITDYLLAALTLTFALRLWRGSGEQGWGPKRLWAGALLASALAAAAGGTFHGFRPVLASEVSGALWKVTVLSVGVGSLCLLSAAAVAVLSGAPRRLLVALALVKFAIYAAWMTTHDAFLYVIADYAPALLIVLLLFAFDWFRSRPPAAPWIVGGILVSFAAAGIQAAGIAPHPHFNHNDLYHVVQMGAFYLLYRGGMLLTTRTAA